MTYNSILSVKWSDCFSCAY